MLGIGTYPVGVADRSGDAVDWVLGASEKIRPRSADLIIMSGNVAMHILKDDWYATLRAIAEGLQKGDRIAVNLPDEVLDGAKVQPILKK